MTDALNPDRDAELASNPSTTAEQLQYLAMTRPDLWPVLSTHPNMYPELLEWIQVQHSLASGTLLPVAVTPPVTTLKKSPVGLIVGIAVGVLAIVGAGAFWFLGNAQTSKFEATRVSHIPEVARVVSVSTLGSDLQLRPIGADGQPTLQWDDQSLVALTSPDEGFSTVVAVANTAETGFPDWSVTVPTESLDQGCSVSGSALICGDTGNTVEFDLSDGAPLPLPQRPVGSGILGSSTEEDASDEVTEDTEQSTEEVAQSGGDTEANRTQNATAQITIAHSESMPYAIRSGELVDQSGRVVTSDLPGGQFWGMRLGDSNKYLISDGQLIFGVRGGKELWRTDLGSGSKTLNNLEDEGFVVSGNAVVMATPENIRALNVSSGETIWQLDTPVSSWSSDDTTLLVVGDDALSIMEYPEESSAEDVVEMTVKGADEPVDLPTVEEVGNSTLEISEDCAEWGGVGDYRAVQFQGGQAGEGNGWAVVLQEDVGYTTLNGEPVVIVSFYCNGGGSGSFSDLGVYDADLNRLSQERYADGLAWTHGSSLPVMYDMVVSGNTITYTTQGTPVAGDGGTSVYYLEATVTLTWNGQEYVTTDVVYNAPSGPVRAPDMDFMTKLFARAEAGDDDVISPYVDASIIQQVQEGERLIAERDAILAAGGDPIGYESLVGRLGFAPEGGALDGCTLIPPAGSYAYISETQRSIDGGRYGGWSYDHDASQVQPGDFVCGVSFASRPGDADQSFPVWWLVRMDEDGIPYVYAVHRAFS